MRQSIVILGGLGALALLTFVASGRESAGASGRESAGASGLPTSKRVSYYVLKPGVDTPNFRIGPAMVMLDGHPIPPVDRAHGVAPVPEYVALSKELHALWSERRKSLPKDADPQNTDEYSKELYWVPSWLVGSPEYINIDYVFLSNGVPIDEYGRSMPGHFGTEDTSLWGQTFGGLLKNPLFQAVVVGALIASGPQGVAIYGAYTMWQNRGKNLTATNIALTAARSYAVGQCGTPCGAAFDFGVGVASGKSYDKAAEDALYQEMSPQQRAIYTQAKQTYGKLS